VLTHQQKKYLPLLATGLRVFASPLLFVALVVRTPAYQGLCAVVFILASLTDWLDGYWARRYNARSTLGKIMDPIADKVLVLTALIILLTQEKVDPVMVTILLSRDIFIGGVRSAAAAEGLILDAIPTGKWKTALQMIAVPCLFLTDVLTFLPLQKIGYALLWLSVLLSMKSGCDYTRHYWQKRKDPLAELAETKSLGS
jgi:CDP-diacylglycerol--glycerol-3-phosphate 3-phosphatidyltransferase